jgi:hypothetical protein
MNLKNIIIGGIVVAGVIALVMVYFSSRPQRIPVVEASRFPTDWTYLGKDEEGDHYYHPDSEKGSPGVERVWTKVVFTPEGRDHYTRKRRAVEFKTEGYDGLSHRNVLWELNCFSQKREYSTQEVFELTKDGNILDYARAGTYKDWQAVPAGSVMEKLCTIVCPEQR